MTHFNWQETLTSGSRGEQIIFDYFAKKGYQPTWPNDYESGDFEIISRINNKTSKVEVKTDTHDPINIYHEIGSANKYGGPLRAVKEQIDYYIIYYINANVAYCYNPMDLVNYLTIAITYRDAQRHSITTISDGNTWTCDGYTYPIEGLNTYLQKNNLKYMVIQT